MYKVILPPPDHLREGERPGLGGLGTRPDQGQRPGGRDSCRDLVNICSCRDLVNGHNFYLVNTLSTNNLLTKTAVAR